MKLGGISKIALLALFAVACGRTEQPATNKPKTENSGTDTQNKKDEVPAPPSKKRQPVPTNPTDNTGGTGGASEASWTPIRLAGVDNVTGLALTMGNSELADQLAVATTAARTTVVSTIRGQDITCSFDTLRIRWNSRRRRANAGAGLPRELAAELLRVFGAQLDLGELDLARGQHQGHGLRVAVAPHALRVPGQDR